MARAAHGTVTVQKPGGRPRRVPASHWIGVPDTHNYLKKAGYQLVADAPPPIEAKDKSKPGRKPKPKPAEEQPEINVEEG